ncbi:hypothetical protein IAT38_004748 [Cryptococcus sp. DSM 104549]
MASQAVRANGVLSPPATEKAQSTIDAPPRIVLSGKTGRILCVADIRGDYHELNRLIREHEATAVIHTGDFGFMTADSVDRMGDKILRHVIQYCPLIPPATRQQLLSIPASQGRAPLINQLNNSSIHFPLSQFPHLLSGAINFPVPVFTTWGLIEDVKVIEKFRTGEYEVQNLAIIDEATTRLVEVGGVKLRLFGLGGTVATHKLCDGHASIAGAQGTMWATALQIGELIDTAQRVHDNSETRLFITAAPISRNGMLSMVCNAIKADLTVSCGLHFRYPVSYNEFSIHPDFESYQKKLAQAKSTFFGLYEQVRQMVLSSLNEKQHAMLQKTLSIMEKVPVADDGQWTNIWHWGLSDAEYGCMMLSIADSRVSAEMKANGLNFAHRVSRGPAPRSAAAGTPPFTNALAAANAAANARRPTATDPTGKQIVPPRGPAAAGSGANALPKPAGPAQAQSTTPAGGAPKQDAAGKAPVAPGGPVRGVNAVPVAVRPPTAPRHGRVQSVTPAQGAQAQAPTPTPATGAASAGAAKDKPEGKPTQTGAKAAAPGPKADNQHAAANGKSTAATADKAADKAGKGEDKPATPAAAASPVANGSAAAEASEKAEKPGHSREESEGAEAAAGEPRPKRYSLYIKGIPDPTTEEEVRELFGEHSSKILQVKIITDRLTNKQKDFAYADFDSEDVMGEALKAAKKSIRESEVTISVSNPPNRYDGFRRGGGRGGPGFRGGRTRGGYGSVAGVKREGGGGGERKASAGGEKKAA